MGKLTEILLMTNAYTYLITKVVIFLTLVHFVFTTSMIHASIITVSYLVMVGLDYQLKTMLKGFARKSSVLPNPTIVQDSVITDDTTNTTNH